MSKIVKYYSQLSFVDFIRKIISYLIRPRVTYLLKKIKAFYFFKNSNVVLGRAVRVYGLPVDISVGHDTRFYDRCVFEFGSRSKVRIGQHVIFSYGVVFCCRHEIVIGNDVQVGEYTSIRDSTHDYRLTSQSMKYNKDIILPIKIGSDVWIGKGCIVLPGTTIEDGVVIGANSVVRGDLIKNGIYAGAPARFIRLRGDDTKAQNIDRPE